MPDLTQAKEAAERLRAEDYDPDFEADLSVIPPELARENESIKSELAHMREVRAARRKKP